jgi:hypothetical protein
LADRDAPPPTTAPTPLQGLDDWTYSLWGEHSIRPGRLYALRGVVSLDSSEDGPTPPPPDPPAQDVEALEPSDGLPEPEVEVPPQSATLTVRYRIFDKDENNRLLSVNTVSLGAPVVQFTFVFRAPLQRSELPDDVDSADPWQRDPQIHLQAALADGSSATVRVSGLTLVELDGASGGWLLDPDDDAVAIEQDNAVLAYETDPPILAQSCPVGGPDCIPYATSVMCPAPTLYADVPMTSWERFAVAPDPILATDHLTRIRLVNGQTPIIRLSGVQHPLIGAYPADPCTRGTLPGRSKTIQADDLLNPRAWDIEGPSFVSQLRFLGEPRAYYDNYAIRDFLFGDGVNRYSWSLSRDAIRTNILSEVRLFNQNFSGWDDHVYRPVSHHEAMRAVFCNAAAAVRRPDWTAPFTEFKSYCDFAEPGDDCVNVGPSNLNDETACSLPPVPVGTPDIRVVFDANMYMDGSTFQTSPENTMALGGLATRYLTASVGEPEPSRPGGATIQNTLAENVDTNVWSYPKHIHEILENVCDVKQIDDFLLGQPAVGEWYYASPTTRQACAMSQRASAGGVHGLSALGIALDSPRLWSSIAAGYPDVVPVVGVVNFEDLGSRLPTYDDPEWGLAARCLWNPEWAL